MKRLSCLAILFCFYQLSAEAQLATTLNAVTDTELVLQLENPQYLLLQKGGGDSDYQPATREEIAQMRADGWLPLDESDVQGTLTCQWADGEGGTLTCPEGSVSCGVYTNGINAAIACEDVNGVVTAGPALERALN